MRILLLLTCFIAASAAHAQSTQFFLLGDLEVETVQCLSYFVQADYQGYGQVNGTGCSITGPWTPHDGNTGHTSVSLTISGVGNITMDNCRVASWTGRPGNFTYTIDCTY